MVFPVLLFALPIYPAIAPAIEISISIEPIKRPFPDLQRFRYVYAVWYYMRTMLHMESAKA
jgi:hypothetical protein